MKYESVIEDFRGCEAVVASFETDKRVDLPALAAMAEDIAPSIERIRAQRQRLIDRPYDNDYIQGVILGLECALEQLGVKP